MATSRAGRHELLAEAEWQSWNAVLMVNRVVLRELDVELRRQHGIAVSEFDVLITLFNADDHRVGMSALADRVMLSPAGTTHLVTRLERDRLVRREVHPEDGRKAYAVLTPAGDAKLRAARRTHNAVLRRTFLAVTNADERRLLQRLWRRLASDAPVR
jgi:DNA-binding MarR family transcriptional regulator